MTAQHTPTPYSVDENPRRTRVRILNAGGVWTATIELASANTREAKDTAAFIVLACNAHDDLVAALKAMLVVEEAGECEEMHPDVAKQMAHAALAKAGAA